MIVLILGLSLGTAAFAANTGGTAYGTLGMLEDSNFEAGDGNRDSSAGMNVDWNDITTGGRVVGSISYTSGDDKPSGSNDNSFGAGTKEDLTAATVVLGSIPPNKNDLKRLEVASEFTGGSVLVYLGWTRKSNIGNANLDFEINQATVGLTEGSTGPVRLKRTAGDLLITYDFPGNGTPALSILTWTDGTNARWVPYWTFNSQTDLSSGEAGVSADGLFGEAGLNLSALGIFGSSCRAFTSAWVKSRSSSSFTAEVKDFIAPIGVDIRNCGKPKIAAVTTFIPNIKVTMSDVNSGGATDGTLNRLLTVSLTDGTSPAFYSESFVVTGSGDYPTDNKGSTNGGYTISTSDGTFLWKAAYAGDSKNDAISEFTVQVIDIATP